MFSEEDVSPTGRPVNMLLAKAEEDDDEEPELHPREREITCLEKELTGAET